MEETCAKTKQCARGHTPIRETKAKARAKGCQWEGAWQADPAATSPQQSLGAPNPRPPTTVCRSGQTISPGPREPPPPGLLKGRRLRAPVSGHKGDLGEGRAGTGSHVTPGTCSTGRGTVGSSPDPWQARGGVRRGVREGRSGLRAPLHTPVCTSRHVGRPFEGRACWRTPGRQAQAARAHGFGWQTRWEVTDGQWPAAAGPGVKRGLCAGAHCP